MATHDPFTEMVVSVVQSIPAGRVATYGQVAALAGEPRAARQVVRALHTLTDARRLPWHRVINAKGRIALPRGQGYDLQRKLLKAEGVKFGPDDTIDLARFGWQPRASD
jgi:methylated-DNA-protein-cysteine methyltransferase related protein